MPKQTETGKAFEYACAVSIKNRTDNYTVIQNSPYETAKRCFSYLNAAKKVSYNSGADAAIRIIDRLEPMLFNEAGPLVIKLNTDSEGQSGDVRDVICSREGWTIGLSCKHNHEALKHSRLSDSIDFGKKWFDIPCSHKYFDTVTPIFHKLREIKTNSNNTALWSDLDNKEQDVYIPVLNAFIEELVSLDKQNPGIIPERLIKYLIGNNDYYKVIMEENKRYTKIQAININGSLNKSNRSNKALIETPRLSFPSRFIEIGYENDGKMINTIHVVCDQWWNISMRIHNASSRVEPSLKFDVQLPAMPNSILSQIEPWN